MKTKTIGIPASWEKLEYHPLSELCEFGAGIDVDALAAFMAEHGYDGDEAIVLHEGKILDGRHKHAAAIKAGVTPTFREFTGKDAGAYVSKKIHRQHFNESQRSMYAAGYATATDGRPSGNRANLRTRKDAADLFNVSERSIVNAKKVQEQGVPELADAVKKGEASVSAAATVADLPEDEQKAAVESGTVKAKAKEQREQKAAAKAEETEPTTDPCEEFVGLLNRLCRGIDSLKKDVENAGKTPTYGQQIHVESITYQLEAARKALWQSRPTEACNCVKGGEPNAKCKACYGSGKCPAKRVLKGGR